MRYISYIAAFCFIFTGVGHLLTETVLLRFQPPITDMAFVEAINLPRIDLLGRIVSYAQLTRGFSLTFGVLLLGFGLLQWGTFNRKNYLVGLSVASVLTIFSIAYFFIVPITTMLIATILYTFLAFVTFRKEQL